MDAKYWPYFSLLILQWMAFHSGAFEIQHQCKLDSDCGTGSFCQNAFCERCIPCEQLFNRFPPIRNRCARLEDDCGRCLPGYQAEDLTSQRRSMKCFSTHTPPYIEKPTTFSQPPDLIYVGIGLFVIGVVFFMLLAGFSLFTKLKSQATASNQSTQDQNSAQQKLIDADDRLPPPYEAPSESGARVGLPRASDYSYTLVLPEQDILNHAAPFEPYHIHKRNSMDLDSDLHVADDAPPTMEDGTGSTETIPSLWEPSAVDEVSHESSEQPAEQRHALGRSYSFDSSAPFGVTNLIVRGNRSDPAVNGSGRGLPFGGQSYANRHVQLSIYRSQSQITASPESNVSRWSSNFNIPLDNRRLSGCRIDDGLEPSVPQSFAFNDNSSSGGEETREGMQGNDLLTRSIQFCLAHASYNTPLSESSDERERGSQDSGFFDHARRRPATEELEFGVAFYIKRSRQVD